MLHALVSQLQSLPPGRIAGTASTKEEAHQEHFSLRHPDPWKLGESAGGPSPALTPTLSPFEGERERERGPTSIPTPIQAHGSGAVSLITPRRKGRAF